MADDQRYVPGWSVLVILMAGLGCFATMRADGARGAAEGPAIPACLSLAHCTDTPTRTPTATTTPSRTPSPPPISQRQVSASRIGSDVVLSWMPDPAAVAYRVYRGNDPYFTPAFGSPYAETTSASFTDAGAIGDPAVNHFYVVTSVSSGGVETAYDNRVGEFDFALSAGVAVLDDIAVPLDVSAVITNADSLADSIDPVHVRQVLKWDAQGRRFLSWSNENGFGDNFPVQTGDNLFLLVDALLPPVASFVGRVPEAGSLRLALSPGSSASNCGLNFVSLPLDQPHLATADAFSDAIGGVVQMSDWDASLQHFLSWSNQFNFGDDFPTTIGYPYMVCLDETAPSMWPPDGGATWTQLTPPQSPSARGGHDMVYDAARGQIVLCGGQDAAGNYDPTTWVWNGATWLAYQAGPSPCARTSHTMAYDAARQRVVLFGGFNSQGLLNDTWEWDGTAWTQRSPVNAPPARFLSAMAYDAARGQVVLFGGFDGQLYVGDTWLYDGVNWTQAQPTTSPGLLCGHWMAYDAARGKVVLFGGASPIPPNPRNETWEWDGNNWSLLVPASSPSPRCCMTMAYDSARQRIVLFGGNDGAVAIGGTWEWTGTTWEQPTLMLSPSARQGAAIAYHAGQDQMLLFGGSGPQGRLGDTWLYEPATMASLRLPVVVRNQ